MSNVNDYQRLEIDSLRELIRYYQGKIIAITDIAEKAFEFSVKYTSPDENMKKIIDIANDTRGIRSNI